MPESTHQTITTTHRISLHGLAGVVFWCAIIALLFYVLGFATIGWEYGSGKWIGLWQVCMSTEAPGDYTASAWFKAVQAMATIGLIFLVSGCISIIIYTFFRSFHISKKGLLVSVAVSSFAAVIFMLIAFIIFGVKHQLDINWSYAFCVVGSFFCLAAGVVALVQMGKSNVI